jgi:hypothetical protein
MTISANQRQLTTLNKQSINTKVSAIVATVVNIGPVNQSNTPVAAFSNGLVSVACAKEISETNKKKSAKNSIVEKNLYSS